MWTLNDSTGEAIYTGAGSCEYRLELRGWVSGDLLYGDPGRALVLVGDLLARQAMVWESIKAERDRRKWSGVKVGANWFHSDDPSRIQILALDLKGVPPGLYWKTLTLTPPPVFVLMTAALADQISLAIMASDAAIFQVAEVHRMTMEASGAPELYDYSGNWPPGIGEAP